MHNPQNRGRTLKKEQSQFQPTKAKKKHGFVGVNVVVIRLKQRIFSLFRHRLQSVKNDVFRGGDKYSFDPVINNIISQAVCFGIIDIDELGIVYDNKKNNHIDKRQGYTYKIKNFSKYVFITLLVWCAMYLFLKGILGFVCFAKMFWDNL